VIEGLDQWLEALTQLSLREPDPRSETLEEAASSPTLPVGEVARRLKEAMRAIGARLTPDRRRSTTEWVVWLEDLLDEIGFPMQISPEAGTVRLESERPAFERLRETLRALVLGESLVGPQPLNYDEFLDELHSAISGASYHEQPSAAPAIDVLRLLDARGGRYQAVAILGLSEGVLPEVEREDPLLDEEIRAALGLDSRLVRQQAGLFYQAATRSDKYLLLTRPYLADDGEAWEASPFWQAIRGLLTVPPRRASPEDPRPLQEAASPNELLFWGVRRGSMPVSLLEPHRERWARLQHRREVLNARISPQPLGPYEGGLAGSAAELAARFGPGQVWSPSRLELYGTCAHLFFASHLLELSVQEPPRPGMDARQLGSLLHELLEAGYRLAADPSDPESVLHALEGAQAGIFESAPRRYGFRPTALWAIEQAELHQAIEETIRGLAEIGREWAPIGLELPFGMHASPPLELDLGGSRVHVRGVIDRVDRRPDGSLRVIDYKTGVGNLSPRDLNQGRRIQLPIYSLAAQETLELGRVVEGFYWSILAGKRGTLRLSQYQAPEPTDGHGPPAAYATARGHVRRIVEGIRAGDFRPIPPPGGCPNYCPAAAWCWRYQPARR
jgi:RecB family exonuclease